MAKASGYQEETRLAIKKKDHAFGMMRKLNQMRLQRRGCDLTIKVGGKEIPVHRNVMMVGSDFFDAMFTHDMQEKQSGVVEMKDISFRIFNKCVEFIYTGDISLSVEECEELLFAAGLLQLTSVCDEISPFLQSRISPSSFFVTRRIANKFSLANLKKVCDDFALTNLDKIVEEKEFNSLEKEYISFLITTKKSAAQESQDSKMSIILKWIKADVENRGQYLINMATLLDFQKISTAYGRYLANKELLCSESSQFMKMLYLAATWDSSVVETPASITFGSSAGKSLVLFDTSAMTLTAYNPSSKNWTQMQPLHEKMRNEWYTAVMMGDLIYVLLGCGKAFRMNIKMNQGTWESIPDMEEGHIIPAAAVCGDDIYVVGNHSMEKYHTSERKWMKINCSAISNCDDCAMVVYDNCIYTIGGIGRDGFELSDVNKYSPSTSSWSSIAPMSSPRTIPAACVHDDKIFVAGGFYNEPSLTDFSSLDPRTNTWTQLSPMVNGRRYFGLFVVSNQMYAVGNWSSACSIEMYDFEEGKWKVVTDEDDNMKIMAPATVTVELPES